MDIAIISVTNQGDEIAERIGDKFPAFIYRRAYVKECGFKSVVKEAFHKYSALIFISSTGIAVRGIAEHVTSKTSDPAVLVIDVSSKFVISLLSGHLGGANELSLEISEYLHAQPVITTATDTLGVEAPDMIAKKNHLYIECMKVCKDIASLVVEGKKVLFVDELNEIKCPKGYIGHEEVDTSEICGVVIVTNKVKTQIEEKYKHTNIPILRLIKKNIVLGIGCRKDYDEEIMLEKTKNILEENNIHERSIEEISTVEIKSRERAIINLSKEYESSFKIYTIEEISKIDHLFEGSDFVQKTIGVRAVSDPCVYLSSKKILMYKRKCDGMTISIGEK